MTCAYSPQKQEIQTTTWMFCVLFTAVLKHGAPRKTRNALTSSTASRITEPHVWQSPVGTLTYEAIKRKSTPQRPTKPFSPNKSVLIPMGKVSQGLTVHVPLTHTLTLFKNVSSRNLLCSFCHRVFTHAWKTVFPIPLLYLLQSCPFSKPYLHHHFQSKASPGPLNCVLPSDMVIAPSPFLPSI